MRPLRCKFCNCDKRSFDVWKQHQRRHNMTYKISAWTRTRRRTVSAQRIVSDNHRKERAAIANYSKQRNLNKHHDTSGESEMGPVFFHQCQFCEKCFVERQHLTEHVEKDHQCRTYKCYHCQGSFATRHSLQIHNCPSKCTTEKTNDDRCRNKRGSTTINKDADNSCILQIHKPKLDNVVIAIQEGSSKGFFKCRHCPDMLFFYETSVISHVSSVHPETMMPHHASSLHPHSLASAVNKHNVYRCNICGKLFSQDSDVKKHLRTRHAQSRVEQASAVNKRNVYRCNICGKLFSQESDVKKHLRTHHAQSRVEQASAVNKCNVYRCDICGKLFSQESDVKKHLRTHHAQSRVEQNMKPKVGNHQC